MKRYDLEYSDKDRGMYLGERSMCENLEGDWVKYEDHVEILCNFHASWQKSRDVLKGLSEIIERAREGNLLVSRDHACSECLAGYADEYREGVIPGFQCFRHQALDILKPTGATK